MKKFKKIAALLTAAVIATSTLAQDAFATGDTAYCVGITYKHTLSDGTVKIGNFKTNAQDAKANYITISGMTALWTSTPTKTKLNNHIDDTVLFLNSHANHNRIYFVNEDTGIDCSIDVGSSDSTTVGLNDITFSNSKLISFVGCETGLTVSGGYNLAEKAVQKGADTALGFNHTISSTSTNGSNWLNAYNGYLAEGRNVSYSVIHATSDIGGINLGTYAVVKGFPGTTIAPISYSTNNFEYTLNIPVKFNGKDELMVSDESIDLIVDEIISQDKTFNTGDYKLTQNIFSSEYKTGFIQFDYYIGNKIKTDRSYYVYIENGVATELLYSLSGNEKNINAIDENCIIDRVNKYVEPESIIISHKINTKSIKEHLVEYSYSYKTNELTYSETVFYTDETLGVIMDDYIEERI